MGGTLTLNRALSAGAELPVFHLEAYHLDPEVVRVIPQRITERHEVVAIARIGSVLTVAVSRPIDLLLLDDLKKLTGCEICLVLSTATEIQNALSDQHGSSAALRQAASEAAPDHLELIQQQEEKEVAATQVNDAPVVRMINLMVEQAVQNRASDIHLEPHRDHFRIRYRIDGMLQEKYRQSLDIYPALIARIKIMSNLNITERRVPQDGRFKTQAGNREIDFRVSLLPTFFGEKAVLRLLDKTNVRSGLDELGFSEKPIGQFKKAIAHPYGMILVTGPTGSGKSTTLYSVLNLLNTPDRNLMTIEDPVEYQIEGITQTQANPDIGLTFANGLRSLLRQSPDVILVGEIRDGETADIAVKAALTGHLVLSTLHTNSAAGAVTRLVDMGVEPFLIVSSVVLVAAQRLLRRICPHCKIPVTLSEEFLKQSRLPLEALKGVTPYKGKGCDRCNGTGHLGRLGAIEIFALDEEIREAVMSRSSSEKIHSLARKKGMETLFENAFNLFKEGKVTLEEVFRAAATE